MKPLSAITYVKENKGKAGIAIFLFFFTTLIFLAGNYIDSIIFYWERAMAYSDKVCIVNALPTDENIQDFQTFQEILKKDDSLTVYGISGYASPSLPFRCTLGYYMWGEAMDFNSLEDMKDCFEKLGIHADLSDMRDGSICLSSALARQYGLKKGDVVDASVRQGIRGSHPIGAILEDDSYMTFSVNHVEAIYRMYVISDELSGMEFRNYLTKLQGDYKVHVERPIREDVENAFQTYKIIFGVGIMLLSVVLSIIVNSVLTGQYIARTYEFGVYRAIGLSKREIYKKCAAEILLMDLVAVAFGAVVIFLFSFLSNELHYIPAGQFLPYFSWVGLYAFFASNLLVVVPTILFKGHGMSRADVTEF